MQVHAVGNTFEVTPLDGVQGYHVPMVIVMFPTEWSSDIEATERRAEELAAEVQVRLATPGSVTELQQPRLERAMQHTPPWTDLDVNGIAQDPAEGDAVITRTPWTDPRLS